MPPLAPIQGGHMPPFPQRNKPGLPRKPLDLGVQEAAPHGKACAAGKFLQQIPGAGSRWTIGQEWTKTTKMLIVQVFPLISVA